MDITSYDLLFAPPVHGGPDALQEAMLALEQDDVPRADHAPTDVAVVRGTDGRELVMEVRFGGAAKDPLVLRCRHLPPTLLPALEGRASIGVSFLNGAQIAAEFRVPLQLEHHE